MVRPFLSIIIATYNSAGTLQDTLDSIYCQTFTDYEVIIVDGLSRDATIRIIEDNTKKGNKIRCITEKDNGVYDAFNKGLRLSLGEWIYFLGSDDRLHDASVLNTVYNSLQAKPCDLLYGDVLFANRRKPYDGRFNLEKLLKRNISHQAIFYNKRVFNLLGSFNTRYKIMGDWDLNLKCFFNPEFSERYLDRVIADFAVEGLSAQGDILFLREVLIPANFRYLSSADPEGYLKNITNYDSCWRLLRNAKIGSLSELGTVTDDTDVPVTINKILSFQSKLSPSLLQNGFISKTCMFISWLVSRLWMMLNSKSLYNAIEYHYRQFQKLPVDSRLST